MAAILDFLSFLKFLNGDNSTSPWISLYTYQWAIMNCKKNEIS